MDKILEWEEEIRQRCIEQNIDITGCHILFNIGSSFYFFRRKNNWDFRIKRWKMDMYSYS